MNYIIIIGAFQALLALTLYAAHRRKRPAEAILNLLLVCICIHLCIKFVIYTVSDTGGIKVAFNTFTDVAYGPLLWIYSNKVANRRYNPLKHWYLLLPAFLASVVFFAIVLHIVTGSQQYNQLLYLYNQSTQYLIIITMIVFPLMALRKGMQLPAFWQAEATLIKRISLLYLFMGLLTITLVYIVPPLHLIKDYYTFNIWIRILAYSITIVISLCVIRYRLTLLTETEEEPEYAGEQPYPVIPACATMATANSIEIITDTPAAIPAEAKLAVAAKRFSLALHQQQAIIARLTEVMEKQKAYSDPDLTLEKLSALSKLPRHHISEVLNQHLGKTFYQFLNDYRINAVLTLLDTCRQKHVQPAILSLAFEAGFNSKSTFNQHFKKTTGFTPSEYLKKDRPATEINPRPLIGNVFITQATHL